MVVLCRINGGLREYWLDTAHFRSSHEQYAYVVGYGGLVIIEDVIVITIVTTLADTGQLFTIVYVVNHCRYITSHHIITIIDGGLSVVVMNIGYTPDY